MGQAEQIVCVQPGCARLTRDFYEVDRKTANDLRGVLAGKTCAPCYESIVRRVMREGRYPRLGGSSKCRRD